jgi:hypothetical protein
MEKWLLCLKFGSLLVSGEAPQSVAWRMFAAERQFRSALGFVNFSYRTSRFPPAVATAASPPWHAVSIPYGTNGEFFGLPIYDAVEVHWLLQL